MCSLSKSQFWSSSLRKLLNFCMGKIEWESHLNTNIILGCLTCHLLNLQQHNCDPWTPSDACRFTVCIKICLRSLAVICFRLLSTPLKNQLLPIEIWSSSCPQKWCNLLSTICTRDYDYKETILKTVLKSIWWLWAMHMP